MFRRPWRPRRAPARAARRRGAPAQVLPARYRAARLCAGRATRVRPAEASVRSRVARVAAGRRDRGVSAVGRLVGPLGPASRAARFRSGPLGSGTFFAFGETIRPRRGLVAVPPRQRPRESAGWSRRGRGREMANSFGRLATADPENPRAGRGAAAAASRQFRVRLATADPQASASGSR